MKKAAAPDQTAQAWARVGKNISQQVHLIAPVAVLIVLGVALNVLPVPINYLAAAAVVGGVAYVIGPRFFASDEPTEAEKLETETAAEELAARLIQAEIERENAESNKQVSSSGSSYIPLRLGPRLEVPWGLPAHAAESRAADKAAACSPPFPPAQARP